MFNGKKVSGVEECYPSSWFPISLKVVAEVQSGVGFPKRLQGKLQDRYPVYKVGDISRAVLGKKGQLYIAENYVNESEAKELKGKIFPEGSTLFAKIGEAVRLNRRAYVIKEGLADNNVMGVTSYLSEMNSNIHYYLKTIDLNQVIRSTTVPSIRKGDIEELKFPLPPLAEQKEIATQLDNLLAQVDTLKNRLDAIPKLLKRFRQSVLAAAVSGESTNTEEFEGYNLGEIALVQTGSTPLKSNALYYDNGDIPWLTSTVTGQSLVTSSDKFVTKLAVEECRLKLFPAGTLLVAMYGEGKTRGQVTETAIEATINQACAAITVDESLASKSFVKICIENNYEQTRLMAEGGAQPNLNLTKVRSIPILLPNHKEQKQIVKRVETFFAFADKIEKRLKQAQEKNNSLTPSLLAKAFRGDLTAEWRKQNPDLITGENSAEALLARIKAEQEKLKPKSKTRKKKA